MNKNPYIYNPIAKMMLESLNQTPQKNPSAYVNNSVANMLLEEQRQKLFENEDVDSLINKASDNAINCFKTIVFDIAPKRDRNVESMRLKLSDISNSKTVKEITAKLEDYSKESDVVDSKYAEAKTLCMSSLEKFCDALNRAVEISKGKEADLVKKVKNDVTKLQQSLDLITKQAQEEADKQKSLGESIDQDRDYYPVNEGLFSGYRGRVNSLKKLLINLITSAEGKDQANGYGRDWKRIFIELDQQRKSLDTNRGEIGEKNSKNLEELEKKVEKFHDEFNKALVNTSNKALQKLESDEEVKNQYGDVTELVAQALDYLTRANVELTRAHSIVKDDHEAKENAISKMLFPLRRGDRDTDNKIKGSGLILAIQNAMCNGIPSAKRLINAHKGPNGKFGPATQSVVITIQKITGNKNASGEIDKTLLHDIMHSDWVSSKDKAAIQKSLDIIRSKVNEGVSFKQHVASASDFYSFINEEKITINQADFEKNLDANYKTLAGEGPMTKSEDDDHLKKKSGGAQALAKKLRSDYSIKIETDDFVKGDGSLKSSYSPEFIDAWSKAIDKADPKDDFSYFFTNGGLYNINLTSSSLKTPCNWKKWTSVRQLSELDDEDASSFMENYLKGWTTFGMVRPEWRYDGVKDLINKNSENEQIQLSGAYGMLESAIKYKSIPFIDYTSLRGDISNALKIILQDNEKSPDLGPDEFIALNNALVILGNAVTFDGDQFVSCIKWVHDNLLGETVANRIAKDQILSGSKDDEKSGEILGFESSRIVVSTLTSLENKKIGTSGKETPKSINGFDPLIKLGVNSKGIRGVLGKNLYYIANTIYPSIISHTKRMNTEAFDDVPQTPPFKCVNAGA